MYKKRVTVINKTGLHARPAAAFVTEASKFDSDITIEKLSDTEKSDPVNAKAIIKLLSLLISKGDEIEITATGDDENAAVDTLVELIESGCKET
ncbi:MAG: HPr family phosphocarrier protein [Defluviitaleaceae bacterium]|nr:HPr family phosphocarrier protein [Defluviitaleaceae bacterium]